MFEQFGIEDLRDREAALRDRIAELERQKSIAAAEQARAAAQWDAVRRQIEAGAGVPTARRGRGLASEIALARRDSPIKGDQHLGFAKALVHEMPYTLAALDAGVLSEWRATLIVRESACLTVEDRRRLDHEMCADPAALDGLGNKRIRAEAKKIAYRLDPRAVVDKAAKAPEDRTVSTRPAADNMVYLTALMPLTQGIACYASLKREADVNPDGRSRGQTMSDTVYERLTGRSAVAPVPITVDVVLSDEALIGTSDEPAEVPEHRPIPAELARRLIPRPSTSGAGSHCAASTPHRAPARWWPWIHGPAPSRAGLPSSSGYATKPAEHPSATRPSAISTTPSRTGTAAPPTHSTGAAVASSATTPRNSRAGG